MANAEPEPNGGQTADGASECGAVPLGQFIAAAILQTMQGVQEAGVRVAELGGVVNPRLFEEDLEFNRPGLRANRRGTLSFLEFDIAIVPARNGGSGPTVMAVSGRFAAPNIGKTSSTEEKLSRISFRLPVRFPSAFGNRGERTLRARRGSFSGPVD